MIIGRMKTFFSALLSGIYNAVAVIGITLIISRVAAHSFGLWETLRANKLLLSVYDLGILLIVLLARYWFNRWKDGKSADEEENFDSDKSEDSPIEKAVSSKQLCDEFNKNTLNEICRELRKPAVILRSAPATEVPEGHVSCLGRVTWQLPGEEWPSDADGNRLEPLATIFVPDFPGIPAAFSEVALITIFAPKEAWCEDPDEKPQLGCVIRVYQTLEGLIPCNYASEELKTCILTPEPVANDMPKWPDCGGRDALWDKIHAVEEQHKLDYHKHICDAVYETRAMGKHAAGFFTNPEIHAVYETHKIGGYPTYAQCDPEIPANYPFVMQINSDSSAGLEIGDVGSYFFYYNAEQKDWRVYSDCY